MEVFSPTFRIRSFLVRYRVVFFCLIGLACVDALVAHHRQFFECYDPDDYAIRVRNCRRQPRDAILIGGSPVSEGIDPSVLQNLDWQGESLQSIFNLGLPGGTMTDFWHALRHAVEQPPRLVVYGITASDLNDHRQEPHGVYSLVDPLDLARWVQTKPASAGWAVKHYARARTSNLWQLYRYRNAIRLWAAHHTESVWPGSFPVAAADADRHLAYAADLQRSDGYAPDRACQARRLDLMKAAGWRCESFHFLDGYQLGDHVRYLHKLVDWAADHRVSLVLVDMPVSAELDEGAHAAEFGHFRAALADIERSRGVKVLRATRAAVGLGDEHFADWIHLNAAGANRFSRWLADQLDRPSSALAQRTFTSDSPTGNEP